MDDYKYKRSAIENLQARAKWIDNYEFVCKEADHLMSLYGQKYAEAKILRWQVEKAIRVIDEFLDVAELPSTSKMEKLIEPLENFVSDAIQELKLWEEKQ